MKTRPIPPLTLSEIERFSTKFTLDNSGCWLWSAAINPDGYGIFGIDKRHTFGAHRISFSIVNGDIEPGLQLDHLCRVRNCVNPKHLEEVTLAENTARSTFFQVINSRKQVRTHCPHGHAYTPENTYNWKHRGATKTHRVCKACRKIRIRARLLAKSS